MTSIPLQGPSWPRLVAIQVTIIRRSGRWVELLGGAVVLFLLVLLANQIGRGEEPLATRLHESVPSWFGASVLIVACWPACLWRGETPSSRRYHWSLPVPRGNHDLARVAAGAVWVLITAGVLCFVQGVMSRGGALGWERARLVLAFLAIYGLASIPAVLTAQPARWFFGVILGYSLGLALLSPLGGTRVYHSLGAAVIGQYGFLRATDPMFGGTIVVEENVQDSAGGAVVLAGSGAVGVGNTTKRPDVDVVALAAMDSDATRQGVLASAIWLGGAVAVLLVASAYRHERA